MSQDICIDPRMNYLETPQACEAPIETSASTPSISLTSADAFISGTPAIPVFSRPLARDTEAFRSALLRDAFGSEARHTSPRWDSPVAYSLWALFPAACSNHPSLYEDGGNSTDGGSGGGDTGSTPALRFTGSATHDTAPCGNTGIVTDLDDGLGVCANYANNNHHLFSWDPARPGAAASIIPLTWAPDQVLRGLHDEIFITTHQNPGLAVVRPIEGSESHHAFPASIPTSVPSSSGRALTAIRPAYPKGLIELADQVFIATSNYDEVHDDYQPGTVLAFQRTTGNFGVLSTSGYNPTSVGESEGRLLVVSSGAVDRNGQVTSNGFADGHFGAVANFNDGKVYPLDLNTGSLSAGPLALDINTADGEGLSDGLRIGADYFIGMGPRLLRLQTGR